MIVSTFFMIKAALIIVWAASLGIIEKNPDEAQHTTNIIWSVSCMSINIAICVLGWWRCFANNYLHWAAVCTWLLLTTQSFVGDGFGFSIKEDLVWYVHKASFVAQSAVKHHFRAPSIVREHYRTQCRKAPLRHCVPKCTVTAPSAFFQTISVFQVRSLHCFCALRYVTASFTLVYDGRLFIGSRTYYCDIG